MSVSYNPQERVFRLDTPNTTYLIAIVDEEGFLGHAYYGKRIPDDNMQYTMRIFEGNVVPSVNNRDRVAFYDSLPTEYSTFGLGDFRESCLQVLDENGNRGVGLVYQDHRIIPGKPSLEPLPATYGETDECETLEITAYDPVLKLKVKLYYTAFTQIDAITRSALIVNENDQPITLTRAFSACLDLDNRNYDVITLHGAWSNERQINRRPAVPGRQGISSLRGVSSAQENPFIALAEHTATQKSGQVYAMNFVYSGNFMANVEMSEQGLTRMTMGIHPNGFAWNLAPNDSFQTPEVVLVYSSCGLNGMTHTFHDLYRGHLCRGPYRDQRRPSVINNWEGTYFDFNEEKILRIAEEAAKTGIEMFVLDDGWFGVRNDDNSGLGDWYVNTKKLPNGVKGLAEKINALGMRFGLWFEPEMVSPDSDLYRAHPDYAFQLPDRPHSLARNQLVLDLTRKEVRDCVYQQMYEVLSTANIEYVKWDMNRPLTNVGSYAATRENSGEIYHRYVLGVYDLQSRMLRDFPNLLLENCSSGGNRFDPGMLYYSPQIWTSDNTDAIDRLRIQEGTALVYPLSTMGAHVAACPSHMNGRTTPFATRGHVALVGCYGYELDLTKLTDEEKAMIPKQLEDYRNVGDIFRTGDYYRLASFAENGKYDVMMSVSKDQSKAAIVFVQVLTNLRGRSILMQLEGLDENRKYRCNLDGSVRTGAAWMYGGLLLPKLAGDFLSALITLEAVEE
ncbi:MAG: alpha-galactosidase [Clostridia bacterium]|nr:alpha-galactosidase [Clostridia bacterium]